MQFPLSHLSLTREEKLLETFLFANFYELPNFCSHSLKKPLKLVRKALSSFNCLALILSNAFKQSFVQMVAHFIHCHQSLNYIFSLLDSTLPYFVYSSYNLTHICQIVRLTREGHG